MERDENTSASDESNSRREVRRSWKRSFDYVFSLVGMMIGLGNVWRFPYLCYKNGGGAFLIAYWTFIIVLIFPMVVLESAVGQLTGASPIKAWNLVPLFKGLGYAGAVVMNYENIFYPILLVWALRWFAASFSSEMPWTTCDNLWNTNTCIPITLVKENLSSWSNLSLLNKTIYHSSVEEFWRKNILEVTPSIEELGGLKMDLSLCLLAIWLMTYFSIWKGVGWTSKIVYVTATMPLVLMLVVVIRGATLVGASRGIEQYLKPNLTKLSEFPVWADAASQVLFSLGACTGCIIALSSYNKFHHNFFRDSIISISMNAFASFLSGFAVFSVLGYLSQVKNTTINEVVESGPDLAYIVYPTALSLLPFPQLWMALFFLTLLFLGFDSQFAFLESTIACLRDIFPRLFRGKWASEIQIALLSSVNFLLGLSMTTRGGVHILNLLNAYSVSGWCLFFVTMVESIAIGWVYGADRIISDMKRMVGYGVPRMFLKVCWKFIIPAISLVLMIYSLVLHEPLKYDRDHSYPVWADVLGWGTALSSILCIPIVAIVTLWRSDGETLVQKLRSSLQSKIPTEKEGLESNNEMKLLEEPRKEGLS